MPAPSTVDELLDILRKSKLLEPSKLDAYLVTHPGPYASPKDLVSRLQCDGLLTPFQGAQLLKGKHRGYHLGKYKILDRIGLGGMGQVFLAEHVSMRRRAALKVLPPDRANDEYKRERFLREARAAGQLDHPNLVRAFDVDCQDDVLYLIMEYVDGITLHDLVARHGPLTPQRAAYYLWQTANGLSYMAQNGLIHRDIKPANLVLDRQGVVKILDLGLVRSETEQDNLTRGEGVKTLGTADYLAPEQAIDCSAVDIRADVYSLGATAYYLLIGRPPFDVEQLSQKLIAHQMQPVQPVRERRPDVPEDLAAVVHRMLEKKPEDRFQHPDEVMAALVAWAQDPPPPPSEEELPTVVGGIAVAGSAVNLSSRPGGSSGRMNPVSSGSMVRYHSDRMKPVGGSTSGRLAPPPTGKSGPGAAALITPAGKGGGTPPPLPPAPATPPPVAAAPTQVKEPGVFAPTQPAVGPPPSKKPAEPLKPAPERKLGLDDLFATSSKTFTTHGAPPANTETGVPVSTGRRRLVAVAFAVAVAIAVWDVILLTGAKPPSAQAETTPANPTSSQQGRAGAN